MNPTASPPMSSSLAPATPSWTEAPALRAAFDREPCLLKGACHNARQAWSIPALDAWLSQGGLGWPELRLFKDGAELPAARYTVEQDGQRLTDVDAVLTEYAAGATLQTIGIDVFHGPVKALCDEVARAFAPHVERIHANAYLTPADARGFDHHWDTHDVIVLQLEGRKHWQVHGAPLPFPAPEHVCGLHKPLIAQALTEAPRIDVVLEPGDVLYLPRGQIHAARTAGACSLHLTLGLHLNTRLNRLQARWQRVLRQMAQQPWTHHALSLQAPAEAEDLLAQALREAMALMTTEPDDPEAEPAGDDTHQPDLFDPPPESPQRPLRRHEQAQPEAEA